MLLILEYLLKPLLATSNQTIDLIEPMAVINKLYDVLKFLKYSYLYAASQERICIMHIVRVYVLINTFLLFVLQIRDIGIRISSNGTQIRNQFPDIISHKEPP